MYYNLAQRDNNWSDWWLAFGDGSKLYVEQERRTMIANGEATAKNLKVVESTCDCRHCCEASVNRLNHIEPEFTCCLRKAKS